jgi:hypothetical protein
MSRVRSTLGACGLMGCLMHSEFALASRGAPSFREECVGRVQVLLPRDSEVAAMLPQDFQKELEGGVAQPPFYFPDGQLAPYSYITYGGSFYVTHPLSITQQRALFKIAMQWKETVDVAVNRDKKKGNDGLPMNFELLPTKEQQGVAWRVNTTHIAYYEVGRNSILWTARGNLIQSGNDYAHIASGLRPRAIFDVPRQQGVCLPHVFIQDDARSFRSIATTYRMKTHPDVLVVVEDSSASKSHSASISPTHAINEFWAQFSYSGNVIKVRSLWDMPSTREIKLGDRAGLASFVKVTRSDGGTDFGYLIVAGGGTESAKENSRFRLFATRDAALALQNGVAPILEADFLEMVEKIAKSVKQRTLD